MRKIVLGFSVAALVLGAIAAPSPAVAATTAELEAMIASLQAQISALLAQLGGTTTGGSSYEFTRDLTVGSTGDDVKALQEWLNANGYTVAASGAGSPGSESTYFGSRTKAALAKFQAAESITPSVGYFGPKTRAALAAMAPVGGTIGGTTTEGCAAGAAYSSTTGAPCTTTTTGGTTVAEEGSITTKLASTPVADANIRTTTNVPVYGIEVTAVSSDMTVDRVDLQVSVTPVGGSANNPGSFVRKIAFYDGSTLLKEQSVANSDFTKDSSDRYHVILTGIGFKVPKGQVKSLTVKFDVTSLNTSDANRTVAVQGYAGNANNVRASDTAGLQSYTDMSGSANTRSHTFKPAGASTVTGSINTANTPDSTNWRVSSSAGVAEMPMLAFDVKSETGDSKVTKIYIAVYATATAGLPDTVFLYGDDGTLYGTADTSSLTSGQQTGFTSLSIPVAKDATKKLILKATFPTTATAQAASTSIPVNGIQWEQPDGSTSSSTPSSALASNDQYMYGAVPKWTLVDKSAVAVIDSGSAGATTTATFKIKLKLTGDGGSVVKPVITTEAIRDFNIYLSSSTASSYTVSNNALLLLPANSTSTLTLDELSPSDATVGDGGSYTMTIVGNLVNKTAAGAYTAQAGNYFMLIQRASSTVGGNNVVQTWGFDDFRTPSVYIPGS